MRALLASSDIEELHKLVTIFLDLRMIARIYDRSCVNTDRSLKCLVIGGHLGGFGYHEVVRRIGTSTHDRGGGAFGEPEDVIQGSMVSGVACPVLACRP